MEEIMDGAATPAQIGALLVALRMKGETDGRDRRPRRVMRSRAVPVEWATGPAVVDTCGTGRRPHGHLQHLHRRRHRAVGRGRASGQARQPRHEQPVRQRRRAGSAGREHRARRRGGGTAASSMRHRLHVRAALPPRHEARRARAPRAGHAHRLQHAGPADQPGGRRGPGAGRRRSVAPPKIARAYWSGWALATPWSCTATAVWTKSALSGPVADDRVRAGRKTAPHSRLRPKTLGSGARADPRPSRAGTRRTRSAESIRRVLGGERGAPRDVVLLNAAAALFAAERAGSLREGIAVAAHAIDCGRGA